jgi:hypothetical protein
VVEPYWRIHVGASEHDFVDVLRDDRVDGMAREDAIAIGERF